MYAFLSSLWSPLTTKLTLFLNRLSWQASLHGVPRQSKASQEQLAAYKPPGIFRCFHMFWKIKDAMSSVPASSWMTELVQRTVLLVEPKPYTKPTTRKLTKVKRLCKAHCAAKNKSTWKIQTPEVKSDRCWEKTESNRRKKHWESSSAVYLGWCHEDVTHRRLPWGFTVACLNSWNLHLERIGKKTRRELVCTQKACWTFERGSCEILKAWETKHTKKWLTQSHTVCVCISVCVIN